MGCTLPRAPAVRILSEEKGRATAGLLQRLLGRPDSAPHGEHQAPPSMGFSRQEYWSGLPLPSPMTNLDTILKSRDITLPDEVRIVKIMVFPVVMFGCENWILKKAEHQRIDASELWC